MSVGGVLSGDERLDLLTGDAVEELEELPGGSVQCVVTSPPYWGLRDYGVDGQIGLEGSPGEYVERLVGVFSEVWRVLRDDGVVWLNIGDSYASGDGSSSPGDVIGSDGYRRENRTERNRAPIPDGVKQKDLVGIPWRVAFALQDYGWYLRSDTIWAKGISGDTRMGSCMPESVTDRPTSAHEHIFLLSKSKQYFYDHEAIKEDALDGGGPYFGSKDQNGTMRNDVGNKNPGYSTGNRRDVWHTNPKPYPEAHFAVYPPNLIRPCILAGTSEKGACAECGAPWARVMVNAGLPENPKRSQTKRAVEMFKQSDLTQRHLDALRSRGNTDAGKSKETQDGYGNNREDVDRLAMEAKDVLGGYYRELLGSKEMDGWEPTCDCNVNDTKPCIVLDPFIGSGTTAEVALKHGRACIGIDINPEYRELQEDRVSKWVNQQRLGDYV